MLLNPAEKYVPFPPQSLSDRQWPDNVLRQAPRWLSTDLRDGNQALAEPMDAGRKKTFLALLLQCGFKEIEVAFPAASQTDFNFVRELIENELIPDDVTIQVLTQAREDLIERTFAALKGAKRATLHLYNATAPLFRQLVFRQSREEIIALAVKATRQIRASCETQAETQWTFEYSPETFCFTEMDFALEICEAVAAVWQPCTARPMIVNLPATVEVNTPNVYADQIEYFCRHFSVRDRVCISVHPHNDRGTGIACAELAMLAGADRIEGCLFGNGERTGNADLVTLALNLYSQGISPNLDFSQIKQVVDVVEQCNQLPVHPRHPYAGELVFTAFSGSHQDAIKKGFAAREEKPGGVWEMPYLPVDPADIGCSYEAVIRVNSQSGKSGAAWMIEQNHGLKLPRSLQQHFSQHVQQQADSEGGEMTQAAIWQLFRQLYGLSSPALQLSDYATRSEGGELLFQGEIVRHGKRQKLEGKGNGLLSAAATALGRTFSLSLSIQDYHEHSLGQRSDSRSATFLRCVLPDGSSSWGVGIDSDVARASLQALLNAVAYWLPLSGK